VNTISSLTVGGIGEHAHVLMSLNPAIAVADATKNIKAGSSAWMTRITGKDFKWPGRLCGLYGQPLESRFGAALHRSPGRASSHDGFGDRMEAVAEKTRHCVAMTLDGPAGGRDWVICLRANRWKLFACAVSQFPISNSARQP